MAELLPIRLNGESHSVSRGATIADLVAGLGLPAEAVAVEVNRQLVPRRRWSEHQLQAADEVELVTLVGGG